MEKTDAGWDRMPPVSRVAAPGSARNAGPFPMSAARRRTILNVMSELLVHFQWSVGQKRLTRSGSRLEWPRTERVQGFGGVGRRDTGASSARAPVQKTFK